jgi:hypothetical protein
MFNTILYTYYSLKSIQTSQTTCKYAWCEVIFVRDMHNDVTQEKINVLHNDAFNWHNYKPSVKYKVVQIWPGLFVCKQVTVCPGHIWTTL